MMLIKDVTVNRGGRKIRVFIYEDGSRAGIGFSIDSHKEIYQDFTLEETWQMANALTAAARILETTKAAEDK